MLNKLIPREVKFFEMFVRMTQNIHEAAQALVDLFENYSDVEERVRRIKDLEHRGDQMTHDVITHLNTTFITPIDREDIHELSSELDDVLDLIDAAASRMVIYKIEQPTEGARILSRLILRAVDTLGKAMASLQSQNHILDYCIEVNSIENEADRASREAIAKLFVDHQDVFYVIKWKEVYEVLEKAVDKCEDIANVLEGVVVKHA